jgi:ribosomal protein L37AE/L43A
MKTVIKNKPQCPQCKSQEIRYRMRTNDYWCRRCGHVFRKEV